MLRDQNYITKIVRMKKLLIESCPSFFGCNMSTIDLERLIVKQTYFIPIERPKLMTAILKELRASGREIDGVYPWNLVEEHKLSFRFLASLRHMFIHDAIFGIRKGTEKCRELIKQKSEEYETGGSLAYLAAVKRVFPSTPFEIYVSIRKMEENGCLCKVEGFPLLHERFRIIEDIKTNDFEIQNAYLTCKRFLETIFEGGLSATSLTEEKKDLLKPTMQLLINDQTSHPILDKIKKMLDEATADVLFCGWVGTILLPKLKEIKEKGVDIHIITHKSSELKGKPGKQDVDRAFGELISMIGTDHISRRPECHCRVLVVDNKALIGSMDLNSISLAGTHREIAIYTEDPEMVRTLRKYFKEIFSPLKTTE